jgi:hypothetical protein
MQYCRIFHESTIYTMWQRQLLVLESLSQESNVMPFKHGKYPIFRPTRFLPPIVGTTIPLL